ncbi:MAG: glycosyltransferase [Lachnospiraceae bacterium]|nr:glycosyltransferase [Lachnospiraceae bacterium]
MQTIDVTILTYKPDKSFFRQIDLLKSQSVKLNRIIIMNTEEKYITNLLFGKSLGKSGCPVDIYNLSQKEFNHGRTRNAAAGRSDADFLIFMTQDAMPEDEYLVENLLRPFEDEKVAVSYARQLPAANAGPIERFNRQFNYPDGDRVQSYSDIPTLGIKTYFCSDVCACYRMSYFRELGGFIDNAIFNEDMIYAHKAIFEDYSIYYASGARVIHSHNYSMKQQFKRNFDLGVSQADHPEVFAGVSSENEGKKLVSGCIEYLSAEKKSYLVPKFIAHCGARYIGYKLGFNYKKLSKKIIWRCTSNRAYWRHHWDMTNIPADVHAGYGKNAEGL